ncbi:hypothetical protein BDR05DRAFT_1034693 [Suillus weaverae]|nr:hypothetical protein BDR05DRAFT_1034693 [Suillus weaverae]
MSGFGQMEVRRNGLHRAVQEARYVPHAPSSQVVLWSSFLVTFKSTVLVFEILQITGNDAEIKETSKPPFSGLPDEPENEIDLKYYHDDPFGFKPTQHLCFPGEIVDSIGLVQALLRMNDKDGEAITIGLYTDDRGQALAPQIKIGHTVAVLYGEQHGFQDMSTGIHVEVASNIKIIPYSLEQLLKPVMTWLHCAKASHNAVDIVDCQKKAWVEGHKVDCKALVGVQWFTVKNWRMFHNWFSF